MKTLYLVRHAKSSWKDRTLDDFDRPLNKRGKRDAPLMARKLAQLGIKPDLILSSPAKRARKTAKVFSKILGVPLVFNEKLYEADINTFEEIVHNTFQSYDSVMLVSHNPGLTMFNDDISDRPIFNIPTTGIIAIDFKTQNDIDALKGHQRFFLHPKQFLKKET